MIFLAIAVDVVAIVLSMVIFVSNVGSSSLRDFGQKVSEKLAEREGPDFMAFTGQYVDGKTVRETIEKYGGEYLIRIRTKRNPLSFAVYGKPLNHKIITKFPSSTESGEYSDYTSPGSFYYVDGTSEFMTAVMTNEYGDIIGVRFTERNSGAVTQSLKNSRYWADTEDFTLEDAEENYSYELENQIALWADLSYANVIKESKELMDSEVENLQQVISELESTGLVSLDSSTRDKYNVAKSEMEAAKGRAESAWSDLIAAYNAVVSSEEQAVGHFEITKNENIIEDGDTTNLQYWINRLGGG